MRTETKSAPKAIINWVPFFQILAMHRTGCSARFTEEAVAEMPDCLTNALARSLSMVPIPEGHRMKMSPLAAEWIEDHAA